MKVMLSDPPVLEKKYDNSYPNLGILYLLAYVQAKLEGGCTLSYLESFCDLNGHIESVKSFAPDVYGISFTSKTAKLAYKTINAVKEAFPGILVIAGGAHATALPEEVLRESKADACVVGEGEQTFYEIVDACSRGTIDFSAIDGVAYRESLEIRRSSPRKFIEKLDDIPFPAREFVDFARYHGNHLRKQQVEASVLVSRGCPLDCSFCANPVWKSAKPWLRYRSIENILQELDELYKAGVREVYFSSDEVNFEEKWAISLFEAITARGYEDLFFQCNMRVDKVSEKLTQVMKQAGVWLVHVGMESGNNRVLKGIGKRITVDQIRNATRLLSSAGIKVFAFMMLYNAWEENGELGFESSEEVDNSIRFCMELYRLKYINYMSWQFCTPMPGSRLYNVALKNNIFRDDPSVIMEKFDEHYVGINLPGISIQEMKWKNKKGIIIKDWYLLRSGAVNWRHVWRIKENLAALLR